MDVVVLGGSAQILNVVSLALIKCLMKAAVLDNRRIAVSEQIRPDI